MCFNILYGSEICVLKDDCERKILKYCRKIAQTWKSPHLTNEERSTKVQPKWNLARPADGNDTDVIVSTYNYERK